MSNGLITTNAELESSGFIQEAFTSIPELKTAIVIYGTEALTTAQQANIANSFDLLITDTEMTQTTLAGIKAANPNILIFIYLNTIATQESNSFWSIVDAHENWFIHDNSGNRVINTYWGGWYLMNHTSGWRDFYVQYSNTLLNSPYVDGIFGDDVINEIRWTITAGVFSDAITKATLTTSDFPSSYLDNWENDTVNFLNYIKNNMVLGKQFIINSERRTTDVYLMDTNVDGKMSEGFAGAITEDKVIESINGMILDSATGKIFIAENNAGSPTSPTSRSAEYCYAATLLGINGNKCYFGYNYGFYYGYEQGATHMPVLETKLGSPSGAYYKSQGVYMRNFTNGIVLLNPSDSYFTVNLGGNYQLANSNSTILNISLSPWSGVILLSHP